MTGGSYGSFLHPISIVALLPASRRRATRAWGWPDSPGLCASPTAHTSLCPRVGGVTAMPEMTVCSPATLKPGTNCHLAPSQCTVTVVVLPPSASTLPPIAQTSLSEATTRSSTHKPRIESLCHILPSQRNTSG